MNISNFIHPADQAALEAVKNIPVFPTVMKKVLEYGLEDIWWSENITSNLRLSEKQMPEIYNRLPPICKKLGISVPELYLQMNPIPNAWTSGNSRVYIVLTLGLIRRLDGEYLDAVLAHECGHIVCNHVLYSMVANSVLNMSDLLMDSLFGQIGNIAMKPLQAAFRAWERASELSADRVATFITSGLTITKSLARLEGIPRTLAEQMDYQAWAEQGKDYEALKNGSSWNKIVRYLANSGLDHPYGPVRAFEAQQWEQSPQCRTLKQSINTPFATGKFCPQCGAEVNDNCQFCKNCGYKLK